jgi:hypothetical protein
MEFTTVPCGRGVKYVIDNNLFSQYSVRAGKRYLKCDSCKATGYVDGTRFTVVQTHSGHGDMSTEIARLQLLHECRKRASEEPTESLSGIFDEESRAIGEAVTAVAFGAMENYMYKRR